MPLSPLDAILPTTPPRSAESAWRGGGGPGFAPVLSRAYEPERSPPVPPQERQEPPAEHPTGDGSTASTADQRRRDDDEPVSAAGETNDAPSDDVAPDDDRLADDPDELAISAAAAAAAAAAGDEAAKAVAAAAGAAAGAGLREAGGLQADASTALESDAPPGESLDAPVDEETAQQDDKQAAGPARPHAASESTAADGKQASAERPGKKKPAPTEQSPADPEPLAAENAPHDKHVDGRAIPQQEPAGQQQSAGERPQPDSEAQPSTTAARDARGDAGKEASARASAAAAEAIKIPPADAAAPALAETPPAAPTDSTATPPAHDKAVSTLERLAAHRLRGAERRHDPDAGPSIDRARFVQRVEGAVRAAHQRDGTIQVRLSPPELGNLRIELALHHGVMTAKLEVETPAVRNALLDSLPQLRERLAQQDIRVEKFDVDVRRDFNGSAGQRGPFDRPDSQPRQPRPDGRMPAGRPRSAGLPGGRAAAGATASDAALDIRI